jgi:hypothetical protein
MKNGKPAAVEVRLGSIDRSVFACHDAPAGAILARSWGTVIPQRTMHSVQLDFQTHLDIDAPLRYLNHSCEPNCGLLIQPHRKCIELHALRDVRRGEELCVDYATFEHEIDFVAQRCRCGSALCRGRVVGFKHLPPTHRKILLQQFGPYVAEHLRQLAAIGMEDWQESRPAHAANEVPGDLRPLMAQAGAAD